MEKMALEVLEMMAQMLDHNEAELEEMDMC